MTSFYIIILYLSIVSHKRIHGFVFLCAEKGCGAKVHYYICFSSTLLGSWFCCCEIDCEVATVIVCGYNSWSSFNGQWRWQSTQIPSDSLCSRACHHTPQPALSLHFSGGNILYLSSPVPLPVTTPHSQRTVMYAACGVWWQKEVEERRAGSVEFALFWWQQIHKHTIISYSSMSGLKLYSYKGRFVFLWQCVCFN